MLIYKIQFIINKEQGYIIPCSFKNLTSRLYVFIDISKDNIDELINIFNKLLFENVGSFKNEFGKNIDLIVFEKKLI